MQEVQNKVLCGYCGSLMSFDSYTPASSWCVAHTTFECTHCTAKVSLNENEQFCPYCFSGCYFLSGIEEGWQMCSNPECSGFHFYFSNSDYKTFTVLWGRREVCFEYSSKYGLDGWTSPLHYKMRDFYERIVRYHKLPRYFLGYRGLFSLTYWYWKRKHIELFH